MEVQKLHDRCGIYTKPEVVGSILDEVGWVPRVKLFNKRLLEPAAGDGAFVVEAARRLVASCEKFGLEPTVGNLASCITSFELHPREAKRARSRIAQALIELKIRSTTANALARRWVTCGDFLLAPPVGGSFTHAVGNPPYVRWSKIPPRLKAEYDASIAKEFTGGDLFLPFLDIALSRLALDGKCGFLCSDRWRFMAFAESFRRKWLPQLHISSEHRLCSSKAFVKDVDAYPSILIAARCKPVGQPRRSTSNTIREAGFMVRVGPALGHTAAFVLGPDENDVEPELLRPWVEASEIQEGNISWKGKRIIAMHDFSGNLLDLRKYPLLSARLGRFRAKLTRRAIVINGAAWYSPIDKVLASGWDRPKLLLPELAKIPRLALDRSGSIPSHGVYAIFADEERMMHELYEQLRDGGLARALEKIAPRVKGGYFRCYKRFLDCIELA
ncbi:Eco57I restriction-modification methylase domain-containing protein [Bradyrhizobium sp. USDA 4473]